MSYPPFQGRSKSTRDVGADSECEQAVQAVLKLMELPIYKLWDPPIMEDEYVK